MESTVTKKVFKYWLPWNADRVATWLENMAAEGWILERTGLCMINFYFKKSEPAKIKFHLEYQNGLKNSNHSATPDSNWRSIASRQGWTLWSREYIGKSGTSKAKREWQINSLKNFLPFILIISASQPFLFLNSVHRFSEGFDSVSISMVSITGLALSMALIGTLSTLLKISRLQKEQED